MIVLALALAAAWFTIARAPATPIGGWLHRALVQMPDRRLAAIRQATVVAVLLMLAISGAAWAIDYEFLRVLMMAAPEAVVWLSMVEVGTLVEVGMAAIAARTVLRVGAVRALMPRPRPPRTRRPAERSLPANDDEDRRAA